jgi:5-carboxymethyl-2-hydroxymuconate isomerase
MRSEIVKVKARALRKGVWFRALTRVERACVDLAIKVVERVRSRLLQRVLDSVFNKLEEAMESQVRRLMREVGGNLAQELSEIAQNWGNKSAVGWAEDSGFIQYLTINHMNTPP